MFNMKTILGTMLALSVMGVSANANAQACYLSEECAGATMCMDKECVAINPPLLKCTSDDACEYDEICHDGYCKIDGVACQNDGGYCYVKEHSGGCTCYAGDSQGWAEGMAEPITGDPPPPTPYGELYEECVQVLENSCDAEIPDPAEVCTADQITTCTNLIVKIEQMEKNCDDLFGGDDDIDGAVEDTPVARPTEAPEEDPMTGSSGSVGEGDVDVDTDGDEDPDVADDPAPDSPDISALLPKLRAQEQPGVDPWEIVDCCETLAIPEAEEFIDCLVALEVTDCEGAIKCEEAAEELFGDHDDMGPDRTTSDGLSKNDNAVEENETAGEAEDGDLAPGKEPALDNTGDGSDADQGAPAQPAPAEDPNVAPVTETPDTAAPEETKDESVEKDNNSDDSGCSFVRTSDSSPLISLIKALF